MQGKSLTEVFMSSLSPELPFPIVKSMFRSWKHSFIKLPTVKISEPCKHPLLLYGKMTVLEKLMWANYVGLLRS